MVVGLDIRENLIVAQAMLTLVFASAFVLMVFAAMLSWLVLFFVVGGLVEGLIYLKGVIYERI